MKNTKFQYDALYSRCERTLATVAKKPKKPQYQFRGQDQQPKSLETMECCTAPPKHGVYTGTKMLGIATMHKSNAVPIFEQEVAEQISQMRR